jgi:hypothetical protein
MFEFGHEFSFLIISLDKKAGVRDRQTLTPAEKVFPAQKVEEFCVNVLTKAGLSTNWSAIVAESLLCAEVRALTEKVAPEEES